MIFENLVGQPTFVVSCKQHKNSNPAHAREAIGSTTLFNGSNNSNAREMLVMKAKKTGGVIDCEKFIDVVDRIDLLRLFIE
jgi:hypothetical protein